MTAVHIILTLLVGACIGYVTNYIAVKMLFRPHEEKKIGNWRIPFTPGVMPKNKPRIARACGNAIAGTLLSKGDLRESLMGSLKGLEEMKIGAVLGDNETEIAAAILEDKVMEEIRKIDIGTLIAEKGISIVMDKLKGTMLAMFVTKDTLMGFAAPVTAEAEKFIENEGRIRIREAIENKLEEMREKTAGELAGSIGIDLSEFVMEIIEKCIGEMDIAGMVEKKINDMNIAEFEALVLSVMKKELNAIVNLGALIGLVIGAINLLLP